MRLLVKNLFNGRTVSLARTTLTLARESRTVPYVTVRVPIVVVLYE
jgi:hypothetical protein